MGTLKYFSFILMLIAPAYALAITIANLLAHPKLVKGQQAKS